MTMSNLEKLFYQAVKTAVQHEKKDKNLPFEREIAFSVYGFDSLDMMNILVSVEEELGVTFDDVEVTENDTMESFYSKVASKLNH